MFAAIRASVVMMTLFTLGLGLAYPLAVTGFAATVFPARSAGSLIHDPAGRLIGSSLIAQGFSRPEYLHPRPSAAGNGYDPLSSGGSNMGPLDATLISRIAGEAAAIRKASPAALIPVDAVTTSGSGLDPDISPQNAAMQASRIARSRGVSRAAVLATIDANTGRPALGFLGAAHVNVLRVNLALDGRAPMVHSHAP